MMSRNSSSPAVRVCTFNLENLFDLVVEEGEVPPRNAPRASQLDIKLRKLGLALGETLGRPEILVAQEIDNAFVLQEVGNLVNERFGTAYEAVSFETSDRRSIEVGFLYDANRVGLAEACQSSGISVARAFGTISPSPGREPIIGTFLVGDTRLRLIGVHLKSKAGISPLAADRASAEALQEAQRVEQAKVLRELADSFLEQDPEELLTIAGDYNDFLYLTERKDDEQAVGIVEGRTGDHPLTDILEQVPEEERYTFIHTGVAQLLDHVFVNAALLPRVSEVAIHHINAGYPRDRAGDPTTSIRCSDHDPVAFTVAL